MRIETGNRSQNTGARNGTKKDRAHESISELLVEAGLVLMDLQMPRLNGLQATRRIRAEFPGVRIIMTTFNDSEESKAASVASGVDWFIPKECLFDELPGAVAQLFSGRAGGAEGERP